MTAAPAPLWRSPRVLIHRLLWLREPCHAWKRCRERELAAYRELKRVEAVRANSERVAHKALALAEEVYGWAAHEPNHHRLLGRLAELREELSRGA